MNRSRVQLILVAATAISCVAGAASTLVAARRTTLIIPRLEKQSAELQQLGRLQEQYSTDAGAVRMFEPFREKESISLGDVLKNTMPGIKADVHPRETRPLVEGWVLKRMDVLFDDVRLADVGRLLISGENQRPPWRLSECTITPSEGNAGSGRVALVMETIERGPH